MDGETQDSDFSYRNLSDIEEQSGHLQHSAAALDGMNDDDAVTSTATTHVAVVDEVVLEPRRASTLLLPGPRIAHSVHSGGDLEPSDWASDECTRQNATRTVPRRGTMGLDATRRGSSIRTASSLDMGNGMPPPSPNAARKPSLRPIMEQHPSPVAATKTPGKLQPPIVPRRSETLHGKDLRQFVSIGSMDQIARHSNSVDWSEMQGGNEEPDHLSLMDPYYDLTKAKLKRVFSSFHPDEHGMVSYDGFRCGLEAMGILCPDDDEFQTFIQKVDEDHSGGISYDEFEHAIQEIKLAQLFNEDFLREMNSDGLTTHHTATPAVVGTIEYSPDRIRSVCPIHQIERFMYSRKPSWATVRWINVEGYDPVMIRRLSVRYRLHPLAVEDALDVDRERPKYENYEDHSSLILQMLHSVDIQRLRTYQRMYRTSLYSQNKEPSPFDSMDKKELECRLKDLCIGNVMTSPEQLSVYILKDVVISVQERPSPLWGVIKARLDTSYSKIRQHGAQFLVYSIVDACVDELTPIVHTLGAKLLMLERLLHLDARHFDLSRLPQTAKQLMGIKRMCKPLNEVIVQLVESNDFSAETLRYFRDVQDHIAIVDEDCDKHLDACKSLTEEYHSIQSAKQNRVSFLLTLVAAIFLPAQFLTGLYGMNFENMPELHYRYGYYLWWLGVVVIAAITVTCFHQKRWL
ncbi:hypothetical protein P43SY_006848 [Pythium insidiosum]|uniref:EF-hand domain-containing protein n=1 Tax=Pythium insidiosum TaxID=114742 RepID=A0AAD5Q6N3_PYTIN|nr:hypothetical protein P43SY_006848 [Pythium insidiosum]